MARTIAQSFRDLCSNLEITDLQQSTVSTRQNNVRDAMNKGFVVLDDFLTGSYSRSTLIAPLSEADIDVFVVLDPKYYSIDGQASLLDSVKRTLKLTYPKSPSISRNGQAVTITFTDFTVDVVPSFYREGGGFFIPTTSNGGKWLPTDPKMHVELSTKHNKTHSGDLVPMVKILKCWNRAVNSPFRSFHLEALAWAIFSGIKISDYSSGSRYFFDKAKNYIRSKFPDPAGYSDDISYYIATEADMSATISKLETAYNRAIKAERFAAENKISNAVDEWQKIFGDYFPSYG